MRDPRFASYFVLCAVVLAGLSLSGCGTAPAPPPSPAPASSQRVAYDPAGLRWFTGPFDETEVSNPAVDDEPAVPAEGPTSDGVEVGLAQNTQDSASDDDVESLADGNEELQIQPCSFVVMPAWVRFTRGRTAPVTDGSQFEIEPGERCVYLEKTDLTRMTVAVYKRTGHTAWLDAASAAHAVAVDAVGAGAVWLEHYPEAFANTLVAPKLGADAVFTIYSIDNKLSTTEQKERAVEWMKLVLGTTGGR